MDKQYRGLLLYILLLVILIPKKAYSRFLVEPTVSMGEVSFKNALANSKASETHYGLNLGYIGTYFMIGLNFEAGQTIFNKSPIVQGDKNFNSGGIGSFLGFHFFDRLKIFSTYQNSTLEPVTNRQFRYFGQRFNFGFGVRLAEGLILQAESFTNVFTQIETDDDKKTRSLQNNLSIKGNRFGVTYVLIF